jgi:hypothetical protein
MRRTTSSHGPVAFTTTFASTPNSPSESRRSTPVTFEPVLRRPTTEMWLSSTAPASAAARAAVIATRLSFIWWS